MYYMSEETKLILSILIGVLSVLTSYLFVSLYIKEHDKNVKSYRFDVVLISGQQITFTKTLNAYHCRELLAVMESNERTLTVTSNQQKVTIITRNIETYTIKEIGENSYEE